MACRGIRGYIKMGIGVWRGAIILEMRIVVMGVVPVKVTKGVEEADKICCFCRRKEIGGRGKRGRIWEYGGERRVKCKFKVVVGRVRHGSEDEEE